MRRICIFGFTALAALALSGCGGPPPLAVVRGTVKLDGKPLPNVRVEFVPEEMTGSKYLRSTATTRDDGSFELTCDTGEPGAVVGWHRVVIAPIRSDRIAGASPREEQPEVRGAKPPDKLAAYSSVATTQERREIRLGENTIELSLGS